MLKTGAGGGEVILTGETPDGVLIRAPVLRLHRHQITFEVYGVHLSLRLSEVLRNFQILANGQPIYAGRAVVSALVNTGSGVVCEVALEDGWRDVSTVLPLQRSAEELQTGFTEFMREWHKVYRILPAYKVVIADMQAFLAAMRLWLEQVELAVRSSGVRDPEEVERQIARQLGNSTTPALTALFEKFEDAARQVDESLQPVHRNFAKRQLHPLLLCAPFLNRVYVKPLGYAGDYEMVNMIARDPVEGDTLFAKVVNLWFLEQPPAQAHRNRLDFLCDRITQAIAVANLSKRTARIVTVGCGPALEVQRFIQKSPFADRCEFTLIDFNQETLDHARSCLESIKTAYHRVTPIHFVRKSVNTILKDYSRSSEGEGHTVYDLVYCAGLFDYLSDPICQRLSTVLYQWVAPGGVFVSTNVDRSNPRQLTMDYVMEWHLIYRSGAELAQLRPEGIAPGEFEVSADATGVNIYFESRKPGRG